jgi:hypothetical protein
VAVGIMIVHLQKFGEDMETVNQFILTNIENLKRGNTTGGHNGKRKIRVQNESGSTT